MSPVPSVFLLLSIVFTAAVSGQIPIAAPQVREAADLQRAPAVAASGHDFLAAWEDRRAHHYPSFGSAVSPEPDIYATRIALDGSAMSDGGVPIQPRLGYESSPAVVWNGSEYVVIHWLSSGNGSISFTRILPNALAEQKVIGMRGGGGERLAAAWNGSHYLVVNGARFFGVSAAFELMVPESALPSDNAIRPMASVASNGEDFVVAWLTQDQGKEVSVHMAMISGEGAVGHSEVIGRFQPDLTLPLTPPTIAWNGTSYLVVWSDAAAIRGRFVNRNGIPSLDSLTFAQSAGVEVLAPQVAWNGAMFLVVFSYRNEWATPTSFPTTNVYAARVAADGVLIDDPYPLTISDAPGSETASGVAATGTTFIIVWEETSAVMSSTVDALSGTVGPRRTLARSLWDQYQVRGAYDGTNAGFVWQESDRTPGEEPLVLFGRVSPDGEHRDGAGIEIGRGSVRDLVFGTVYLATWQAIGGGHRLRRITPEGTLVDAAPLELSARGGVMASDGGSFVFVGTVREAEEGLSPQRLRAWNIGSTGPVSAPMEIVAPGPYDHVPSSIAWNGSHYLLLYHQYLGRLDCYRCFPDWELRMVMLDATGRPLGASTLIARNVRGAVAGGDGRFLVAGTADGRSQYWWVDSSGGLESGPVVDFTVSQVVWDGTTFAAGGTRTLGLGSGSSVAVISYVQRIARDGALLGDAAEIDTGRLWQYGWTMVPARGAVALVVPYVERVAWAHPAGVLRWGFSWLTPNRRRAVGR